MKLLWKNMLKSFFRNKVELMTLTVIVTIVTIVIIGLSGFIIFLKTQNTTINNSGNAADAEIDISSQSSVLPTNNCGSLLGELNLKVNSDKTLSYSFTGDQSTAGSINCLISTVNYIISDGGVGDGSASNPFGNPIGTYQFNVSDDRIMESTTDGSATNSTLYKIVPLQNFFNDTSKSNDNFKLNPNCFPDFDSKTAVNIANTYEYEEYQQLMGHENYINWKANPFTHNLADKSDTSSDQINGIKIVQKNNVPGPKIQDALKWVDKPILIKGQYTNSIHDVDISYEYAKYHNINLNDTITVNNTKYRVVGFAVDPKYIYPQFSPINLTPNNHLQCIIYTQGDFYDRTFDSLFGTTMYDRELSLQLKITSGNKQLILDKLNSEFNFLKNNSSNTPNNNTGNLFSTFSFNDVHNSSYIYANRMDFINKIRAILYSLTIIFSIIIFASAIFSLTVIIKKQINEDSRKLGILKALGYKTSSLSSSYMIIPFVISFLSVVAGFVVSIIFWGLAITMFSLYLNFNLNDIWSANTFSHIFDHSLAWVIIGIVLPVVFTTFASFYITYLNIKKNVVTLLYKKE